MKIQYHISVYSIFLSIILLSPVVLTGDKIITRIDYEYIEACETGNGSCNPISISRKSVGDSVIVIFPSGGTETNVFLYNEYASGKRMFENPHSLPSPLKQLDQRGRSGRLDMDLTGLPDGKYRALMLSCNLGGSFLLILNTKK